VSQIDTQSGIQTDNSQSFVSQVVSQIGTQCGTQNDSIPLLIKTKLNRDIEKENIKEKEKYGEFKNVLLTEEEYHKLEESNLLPYIEKLSSYIASKGKKYKSHYATILTWSRKDKKQSDYKYHAPEPEWLNKEIKEEEMSDEVKQLLEYVNSKD
jgi:hypothetical protein